MDTSLDCKKGLECNDYECELRHLDLVEEEIRQQQQDDDDARLSTNKKQNLIVTASRDMGRSASTWVYNAVRLLYRQANKECDSYWVRCLSTEKLQRRTSGTRAHVLIKTHEWSDYCTQETFEGELLPMFTHVIVSVRQGFTPDDKWMEAATLVVHYEDIVDSERVVSVVLRGLANHLGITTLSDDDLREVDRQLMTFAIPGDQSTKFWSFHARRGGRRQPTKP